MHGRVEHIVSGQATQFTSLAELWAFMAQVLTRLADPSRGSALVEVRRHAQVLVGAR